MKIAGHGKYLGFFIGPESGTHNWSSPLSKYRQRAREIHVAALPAAFSASEYNSKCLPTLLYVSQLCPPPPHLLQTELGAIHKILHLPPQTISYSLAINLSPVSGFNIRSACTAMNASMIRFALKSFPQAKEVNEILLQTTLEHVPLGFVGRERGFPDTPGWDSHAFVSNLACALRHDNDLGAGVPEFAAFIRKIKCKIERNCSIQEEAI